MNALQVSVLICLVFFFIWPASIWICIFYVALNSLGRVVTSSFHGWWTSKVSIWVLFQRYFSQQRRRWKNRLPCIRQIELFHWLIDGFSQSNGITFYRWYSVYKWWDTLISLCIALLGERCFYSFKILSNVLIQMAFFIDFSSWHIHLQFCD